MKLEIHLIRPKPRSHEEIMEKRLLTFGVVTVTLISIAVPHLKEVGWIGDAAACLGMLVNIRWIWD